MKKITLLTLILATSFMAQGQADTNKTLARSAEGIDVSKTGRSIMDTLTPKLKLTDDQTSDVTILVGQFLTHKSDLAGQLANDPAAYNAKLADEKKTFLNGMKNVLKASQYKLFTDMKPAPADSENALSPLFY